MTSFPPHLSRAYGYCTDLARGHYENFPVASVLIPAHLRPHVCAVYAFARRADDFADEIQYEGHRLRRLDGWQKQLDACVQGHWTPSPIFVALGHTIRTFDLPVSLFSDLLSAFRQDVEIKRYADFDALRDYCRRSANPVGRLVLMLFGYRDEQRLRWSDQICTALQLANFWQDISVDRGKGRVYIPQEDLARFGVADAALMAGAEGPEIRQLMAFQVARARALFQHGRPLCGNVSGRLSLELKAIWLGGMGILDAVELLQDRVVNQRPSHARRERLGFLWNTLVPGRFARTYPPPTDPVSVAEAAGQQ